ncbi:MAG: hypothetical protein Q4C47_05890 [Planctomycetia bacterium]|nr:hypothetical protein [Planctomycetia bacterium]
MRLSGWMTVLSVAVLSVTLVGCGEKFEVQTEYVEGMVTYQGAPVPGATLIFREKGKPAGTAISGGGLTDEQGVYKLSVEGGAPEGGVPAGTYIVGIIKKQQVGGPDPTQAANPEDTATSGMGRSKDLVYEDIIPKKFNNPNTSGLEATVTAGQENKIDFPLTDD